MTADRVAAQFAVVWPLAPVHRGVESVEAPPRTRELGGRRIGFIWDYLFHGDEMFEAIRRQLHEGFAEVTIVDYDAFGNIHGPDEDAVIAALPDVLRETGVDSVIAAVGA